MLVREKIDAKSEYYGPYPSVKDARQVLKAVMTYFPLRTSKMLLDGKKTYRPCLNFQMKRCLAPCRGVVFCGRVWKSGTPGSLVFKRSR